MEPVLLHHVSHEMLLGITALVGTLSFAGGMSFAKRRTEQQPTNTSAVDE
ncbi:MULTISPECIES: hypothetical protein [Natronorubrum]|uniref:Uncharacterized protein n=1 Tax=Natronorubrum thiooxidans TaxID=308853 RepID=A0A1N7D6X6_9EURY|nr:hypothetical protein [Natronorubrum thiooxidans]SIR71603.1 hypothetical protein SAMN05421752_10224 [Natronorubrum thiooxidans]